MTRSFVFIDFEKLRINRIWIASNMISETMDNDLKNANQCLAEFILDFTLKGTCFCFRSA